LKIQISWSIKVSSIAHYLQSVGICTCLSCKKSYSCTSKNMFSFLLMHKSGSSQRESGVSIKKKRTDSIFRFIYEAGLM